MNKQLLEISEMELTTEELNDVSGGLKNSQTEVFHAFTAGIIKGYLDAGGSIVVNFG